MRHISIFGDAGEVWSGEAADTGTAHKLACARMLDLYIEAKINTADILAKLDGKSPERELRVIYRHPELSLTAIIRNPEALEEARQFAAQMEAR